MKEVVLLDKEGNVLFAIAEHGKNYISLVPQEVEVRVDGKVVKEIIEREEQDVGKTLHS